MEFIGHFRRLTPVQRNTFIACFLGWSLDAFDFFILILCVNALATQFHEKVSAVTEAIFWTLAMRPVGAFLFGLLADKYGRRPTLMANIIAYSGFELASAFAPTLHVFLVTRALFGIGMGGEWGVGAALAFETLPAEGRGFFSGLLQEGYVVGYLLAALVYRTLFPLVGWRGMLIMERCRHCWPFTFSLMSRNLRRGGRDGSRASRRDACGGISGQISASLAFSWC